MSVFHIKTGIFGRRTLKCFHRHMIYWIADNYILTQATFVMLLMI